MLSSDLRSTLPTGEELPCSDDIPVDNEDQNFVPNWLLFLLEYIWKNRQDWYFAVDMGVYHTTGPNPRVPVVPDGFLSLGVDRRKAGKSRNSYVMWEENNVSPILALEVVSQTPGGEYDSKLEIYRKLGVLYYVVYNARFWKRDQQHPFEVYKLINNRYQLQVGEPYWMPEIGLGIGRCSMPGDVFGREVLSWYDSQGDRYLTEAEVAAEQADLAIQQAEAERQNAEAERQNAEAERQTAEAERQRADRLAARLRELGEEV
jgi:Uma2 family endonuclease